MIDARIAPSRISSALAYQAMTTASGRRRTRRQAARRILHDNPDAERAMARAILPSINGPDAAASPEIVIASAIRNAESAPRPPSESGDKSKPRQSNQRRSPCPAARWLARSTDMNATRARHHRALERKMLNGGASAARGGWCEAAPMASLAGANDQSRK